MKLLNILPIAVITCLFTLGPAMKVPAIITVYDTPAEDLSGVVWIPKSMPSQTGAVTTVFRGCVKGTARLTTDRVHTLPDYLKPEC